VFGIVRRKSRTQLVRQELGQGMEHFKQAATHAALGTGATVGPKFTAARDRVQPAAGRVKDVASTGWGSAVATLAPLATAASANARQVDRQVDKKTKKADKVTKKNTKALQKATGKALARKQSKGKGSKLKGLLILGAAVGAAGAYVMRRRKNEQWDEYDPSRPITPADQATVGSFTPDTALQPADLSGPSGFAAEPGAAASPATTTSTSTVAAGSDPLTDVDPLIPAEQVDQTSSALHSPKVAKLANGTNPA